jgi:uncharacterized BrkB/YihY/UPF0761 family membrane protein
VSNPYGERPDQPGHVRGWAVAIGVVLGLIATFVWMTVVFIAAYSFSMDQVTSNAAADGAIFLLFILPLPLAILMLCFRRTRQAAAGFVMGMAIGTLLVAGLCTSMIVPGLVV